MSVGRREVEVSRPFGSCLPPWAFNFRLVPQPYVPKRLPLHLLQLIHLNVLDHPVDVNHDGYGNGTFGCRDGNGEECEEIAFITVGIKHTVKHCEVKVGGIEHEFHREEYGQCAAARQETENAGKHHDSRYDEEIFNLYHTEWSVF